MAGVYTDNQPDFSFLQPGETKTWSQYLVSDSEDRPGAARQPGRGRQPAIVREAERPRSACRGHAAISRRDGQSRWQRADGSLR